MGGRHRCELWMEVFKMKVVIPKAKHQRTRHVRVGSLRPFIAFTKHVKMLAVRNQETPRKLALRVSNTSIKGVAHRAGRAGTLGLCTCWPFLPRLHPRAQIKKGQGRRTHTASPRSTPPQESQL
uniref:Uncharacterized protein n=1 Tax=Caulerpa lentillifera TaxID=148947 RepID=A0A2Z2QKF0_9CHLO|nr:hypothetical protein [Caulerpa lentillifera]AST24227.1 hypothetical protein [Caulerpa lentillifera]